MRLLCSRFYLVAIFAARVMALIMGVGSAVPLPATLPLMLGAIGAVTLIRRRRK